jgi:MIF4G like
MDSGGGRSYFQRGGGRRGGGRGARGRGGRGRGYRHQPYGRNSNNNNNRNRRPGNRFEGSQGAPQDPETAMIRQVSSFVSRVGELKNIRDTTATLDQGAPNPSLRPVEATTAANINDLVTVLCSEEKMEMLFKYQMVLSPSEIKTDNEHAVPTVVPATSIPPQDQVGKLGHVLIACAAALPLQTPCYAALTLAIHEKVKSTPWQGFAQRCVAYVTHHISKDLDDALGSGKSIAHAACRIKLLLRFLAILGKMGVVQGFQNEQAMNPNQLTIFGFLSLLVEAAKAAQQRNAAVVSYLLAHLVLSTLPYVMGYVPQESITEWILKPLETLMTGYRSAFTPGTGPTAILLKEEQDDGDANGEDEEDEDDEEEDSSSGQVCDTLQDLLRVVGKLQEPSRFALPIDSPWNGLTQMTTPNPESGETETTPVMYTDEPTYLSVNSCRSLKLLIGGEGDFQLVPFSLDGVVFGRLPIFGPPPSPDDDDEEEMEGGVPQNESLQAFKTGFSLVDRFFVSEILRDCMLSHDSLVNPTGLQQGSAKNVAEELLSVCHLITGENPSKGLEYAIVETLYALVAQSKESCALKHTSVSRILLELTRLQPQVFSPALAVAMTNLFGDYLPALVPQSRDNFSRWFSFHLINTDYQWPNAYWEIWQPYALSPNKSSRGDFVRRSLHMMVDNVSDPSILIKDCLHGSSALVGEFFPRTTAIHVTHVEGSTLANLEAEVDTRIWDQNEDPSLLLEFLSGQDVSDALQGVEGAWLRSQILARVLLSPAIKMNQSLKTMLDESERSDDEMVDDTAESKDLFAAILDAIPRYGKVLKDVLQKESEASGDITQGGALCLRHVEAAAFFNASMLQEVVACFVKQSVFNGVAVARWALGDLVDPGASYVVPLWWTFVSDAFRLGSPHAEGSSGMTVDGNAAENLALVARNDLLKYVLTRVCTLLAVSSEKKLNPMQVDLVEGTKIIASKAVVMAKPEERLSSSLADLCSGFGGSVAVELLRNSLLQL